jgi:hypothetical protein
METPLSGSHLGPHTRPMCPCNKAVCREAVCSFVTLFNAACLIHQLRISTEVIDDEKPIQLDKAGSPCKGLGDILGRFEERVRVGEATVKNGHVLHHHCLCCGVLAI